MTDAFFSGASRPALKSRIMKSEGIFVDEMAARQRQRIYRGFGCARGRADRFAQLASGLARFLRLRPTPRPAPEPFGSALSA